ncbi:MAG: ADP-ribosylglycohydrolase family protein [Bacteroidetes bacterium]|nr:ADP-ribosylglycohydrolase family protein [Bacteroidota bacterium]
MEFFDMSSNQQRGRNALLGLAMGDSLSWTSMFHRSVLLPPWTRRIRREMDAASESNNVIVTPMPFSLNQPAEHFDLSPALCTEWSAFTAETLLHSGPERFAEELLIQWRELADSPNPVRGYVSTQGALQNIRNGILPPQSGRQHPHYFDDSALLRAVPIGVYCGSDGTLAARLAGLDAAVTNSEDGIWGAQSVAVTVGQLTAGSTIDAAMRQGIAVLPEGSWIRRSVDEAFRITAGASAVVPLIPELQRKIVNREYSYGNVAAETLALAFAIVKLHGSEFNSALSDATAFPKSAESLPSLVGALAGAHSNVPVAGRAWTDSITTLKGIALPAFVGKNYLSIIEEVLQHAENRRTS